MIKERVHQRLCLPPKQYVLSFAMRLCLGLCVITAGCTGTDSSEEEEEPSVKFPVQVELQAEQALIAPTVQVLDKPDFANSDLVTYSSATMKISSGCPESPAHCLPLHICRPKPQSKPSKFSSLEQVCKNRPAQDETYPITNAHGGMGFTVKLNTADGCARFWIKELTGSGDSAKAVLVYDLFDCY